MHIAYLPNIQLLVYWFYMLKYKLCQIPDIESNIDYDASPSIREKQLDRNIKGNLSLF